MLSDINFDRSIMRFALACPKFFSNCLFFIVPLAMLLVLAVGAIAIMVPVCLGLDWLGLL